MKIKNISNQELTIPFKKGNEKVLILKIQPGQIVYCEEKSSENKQVIILLKKKKIEITQEEKPSKIEYYHPYGVLPHSEILKLKNAESLPRPINDTEEDDDDGEEDIELLEVEPEIINSNSDPDISDISTNVEFKNNDLHKNKGGRPKGSKNKKKQGRPKKKRPRGRPSKNKKQDHVEITSPNNNNIAD